MHQARGGLFVRPAVLLPLVARLVARLRLRQPRAKDSQSWSVKGAFLDLRTTHSEKSAGHGQWFSLWRLWT